MEKINKKRLYIILIVILFLLSILLFAICYNHSFTIISLTPRKYHREIVINSGLNDIKGIIKNSDIIIEETNKPNIIVQYDNSISKVDYYKKVLNIQEIVHKPNNILFSSILAHIIHDKKIIVKIPKYDILKLVDLNINNGDIEIDKDVVDNQLNIISNNGDVSVYGEIDSAKIDTNIGDIRLKITKDFMKMKLFSNAGSININSKVGLNIKKIQSNMGETNIGTTLVNSNTRANNLYLVTNLGDINIR